MWNLADTFRHANFWAAPRTTVTGASQCCPELCPRQTQAGTQAALLGLHMLSGLPLSLDSRAFSALPSAREKPGSFHNSNHTADTFSESEVSRLSWQRGLTKMLCALEPLRRKAGCRMYIQGGWSSPQHRNFGGC